MPPRRHSTALYAGLVVLACLITVLIYWPGLHGPFLLDDVPNLEPLKRWLDGQLGWRGVVFGNRSGALGRPLSMASFLLDVLATHNMNSFTFKPTNLAIHIACGLAMLWLGRQVFRRWQLTSPAASWWALGLAALWLWLPLNVNTVLYTVQRMAQLSALFMLLALACYMAARERIERGRASGQLLLWLGVPTLTVLATLSKENGVLVMPLALVLEWFLFAAPIRHKPASVRAFFLLTVLLPGAAALAWLALHPGFITGGYVLRPFTLIERLLTEPRVLWSYVQTMLLPYGPNMSLYHDNYMLSTSLLQPWTTLPAIAAWLALAVAGWCLRKRNPLFAAGIFFYLVGQSLESGLIALEIYFEHRNYLPSFGILLSVFGLLAWGWSVMPTPTLIFRKTVAGMAVFLLGMFAFGTHVHAENWSNLQIFYATQEAYNPTSPRLNSELAARAMEAGDLQTALQHIALGASDSPPRERATATLWRFLAYCTTGHPPPALLYTEFDRRAHGMITQYAMTAMEQLAGRVEHGCPGFDVPRFSAIAARWIDAAPMPRTQMEIWRSNYNLGRIIATSGDLRAAQQRVHAAWQDSGFNNGVGVLLFQLDASLGDVQGCREAFAKLEQASHGSDDQRLIEAVATFRKALDSGQIHARQGAPIDSGK